MKARPRTILILAGIFVAGAATGALLAWQTRPPWMGHPRTPEPMAMRILERLDADLNLTKEQRAGIEAVLKESATTLDRMRRESFENGAAVIAAMNMKIDALLTPEQREKFAQLQREQKERMQRQQSNRGPFGGPDGPPMMPGGPGGMDGPPGGFPGGQPPPSEMSDTMPPPQQ